MMMCIMRGLNGWMRMDKPFQGGPSMPILKLKIKPVYCLVEDHKRLKRHGINVCAKCGETTDTWKPKGGG